PEREFGSGGARRIRREIRSQQSAEPVVVGASGYLDRPASLEAPAVARLRVAEPGGQIALGVVALLRRRRSPELFHELELPRLVGELREEGGYARRRIDLELGHRRREEGKVLRVPGGGQARHDRAKLIAGQHGYTVNGCSMTNAATVPSVKKFGTCVAGISALIAAWNFA